mmetsp:Transcript_3603/g.6087  ORF Transcript_3603/g.6087 Transcript_3603/m.6087 type:complete len:84 (+) Transcript_3603:18-269(+)
MGSVDLICKVLNARRAIRGGPDSEPDSLTWANVFGCNLFNDFRPHQHYAAFRIVGILRISSAAWGSHGSSKENQSDSTCILSC